MIIVTIIVLLAVALVGSALHDDRPNTDHIRRDYW